ncbi:copper fist DNA binding domain-containing protein [Cokeromyces recurvatus]|uniref:copper fist DNA binding domain-containing protein n=1 Tax=Cokeromyces recurvatus TaxID=90255 RepID=UPI00221FFA76|nr:copper fist DNA binding domain-containing protein [Cokeromyces recurvatus]KAI7900886.1 copper fist DNA binding domain-containing protein [Cokeromyces recurvatus]
MLINGQKWSCETCIKGHRASHCQHEDRQLILIKKKGRPSTQCNRCKELRTVRQLHVKCECGIQNKNDKSIIIPTRKKVRLKTLRPIAPKNEIKNNCCQSISPSSCCQKKSSKENQLVSSIANTTSHSLPLLLLSESVPLPNIPPPTSCCGPPAKNQQGETIRVVTCRCGDDCACIGCDAHPSRAMKEGKKDIYIGFDMIIQQRQQQQQISIDSSIACSANKIPSSILSDDGILLCGCGCSKSLETCSCCTHDL